MSAIFRQIDRGTPFLLPPSINDWLPEDYLARFIVEIVRKLDLTAIKSGDAGRANRACAPESLLGILFYGYATGVFSSRKLEQVTYDLVPFRFLGANEHPDDDTSANFRKKFLPLLRLLFVQILLITHELGRSRLGQVSLDGTKIQANASKNRTLNWQRACQLESKMTAEVENLFVKAKQVDKSTIARTALIRGALPGCSLSAGS